MSEQETNIKLFRDRNELKLILKTCKDFSTSGDCMHLDEWLAEKNDAPGYGLFVGDKLVSFALLSKCDYDPMKKFKNPYILNYIYTVPEYRSKGYGSQLVQHLLKGNFQLSAFCSNEVSVKLLEKNGWVNHGEFEEFNKLIMLRSSN